jgi:DNA-binding PadR family transcriptional regulator
MRLLIDEPPLQVLPSLATAIGLNKAIVLQQLHYWLQTSSHQIEGKKWIYNTYEEWRKQFPFWSEKTIKRTFRELEKDGLIVTTTKFNKSKFDKTKWYTINYEKLAEIENRIMSLRRGQIDPTRESICPDEKSKLTSSLTEITTENTTETTTEGEDISPSPAEEKNQLKKIEEKRIDQAGNGEKFDDDRRFESDSANKLHRKTSSYVSPHARQIIDAFKHFFLQKFGMPPTITSKSIRELDKILSQLNPTERAAFVEKAKEAVKEYLSSRELFVKEAGYNFHIFVTTMQKYMLRAESFEDKDCPSEDTGFLMLGEDI